MLICLSELHFTSHFIWPFPPYLCPCDKIPIHFNLYPTDGDGLTEVLFTSFLTARNTSLSFLDIYTRSYETCESQRQHRCQGIITSMAFPYGLAVGGLTERQFIMQDIHSHQNRCNNVFPEPIEVNYVCTGCLGAVSPK